MMYKIVLLDGYTVNPGDLSWEPLQALGQLVICDRTSPDQVAERAKDAEIILTNKVKITGTVMDQLPHLKFICVLATGYNVVDVMAAKRHGIIVSNIPAYSTMSVAQHVFALLLNLVNHVDHYASENRKGRWSHNPDFCYWDKPIVELSGKLFGIVGLGNIGSRVALIAQSFGMRVAAFTSKRVEELPGGVEKMSFSDLLSHSDVLSLHCPLTQDTCHLINRQALSLMRPSAILINTARGPLVDEDAVAEALSLGRLHAYAADVLSEEPPATNNPLLGIPNAYITPHIAWASVDARQRLIDICVANVKAFLGGNPINKVW